MPLSVTIGDVVLTISDDTVNAVADTYGYRAEVPDTSESGRRARAVMPNPQTKEQFLLAHVVGHLNEITRVWKKIQQDKLQQEQNTVPGVVIS